MNKDYESTKDITNLQAQYMRIKEKYLRAIDLLNDVKNDDVERHSRPSYYYDVCNFLVVNSSSLFKLQKEREDNNI